MFGAKIQLPNFIIKKKERKYYKINQIHVNKSIRPDEEN